MDVIVQSHNNTALARPYQTLSQVLQQAEAVDASTPRYSRWQDVLDAMEAAVAQDQAKADKSSMRARVRKSAADVALLESLTGMIPEQDGLSVLRCGLATLFKMVGIRLETRALILQAFEDIPETFSDAVSAALRFPGNTDIRDAVVQLGHTLAECVAVLIDILLHTNHSEKRKCKYPVPRMFSQRPGKESETVRNCLAEIERAMQRVKQCSQAALETTVVQTFEVTSQMKAILASEGAQVRESLGKLSEDIKEAMKSSSKMLGWTEPPAQQQLALPWPTPVPSPATATFIFVTPFAAHPHFSSPPPSHQVSCEDLLASLDVPDHSATEVLGRVRQRSTQPPLRANSRAQQLLSAARFRAWLSAPPLASDLLLVDGHCGPHGAADNITPMSAFCASLSSILLGPTPSTRAAETAPLVLHHFCAHHPAPADPLSGPAGLLRSLLHQLLIQSFSPQAVLTLSSLPTFLDPDFDSDPDSPGSTGSTTSSFLQSLVYLLKDLLPLLPPTRPIFLVVDSISTLETTLYGWRGGIQFVLDTLLDLVQDEARPGPALRVLLASPERSTLLEVPRERRIELRGGWYGWGSEKEVIEKLLFAGEGEGGV